MKFPFSPKLKIGVWLATLILFTPAWCAPVQWQSQSLQLIQSGGNYARVARVDSSHVACIYEHDGVRLKRSADNGKSWGDEIKVASLDGYNAANPELLILPNGDWLCSFNGRPRRVAPSTYDGKTKNPDGSQNLLPFTIETCRSSDAGLTWSAPVAVYRAGTTGAVGCWEPRAIVAPGGSIQLYFANEFPYDKSDEQQITRLISRDNGHTWSAPQTVSFRAQARDGMPVPIVLHNGKTVMAIEDNGLSGTFKPVIIAPQTNGYIDGASRYRWSALQEPLAVAAYAGAPYLCQMKNGTTVLSAQLAPDGEMNRAHMAVWTGDENARDFADLSFPFAASPASKELWSSLWVKDSQTVSALTSAKINGVFGVWCVDGKVAARR